MSLQVWLPLNGDLRNQGLKNLTITNIGTTVNNNGKLGKCYSFNGSSNYLRFLYPVSNLCNELSYCCWVKFNSTSTGTLLNSRKDTGKGLSIFFINSKIRFDNGTNSTESQTTFTQTLSTGTWYHIAVIQTPTKRQLFINGALSEEIVASPPASNTAQYVLIGGSSPSDSTPNGNYLNAYMNDIRIYNHALSTKEVEEISKGLIIHYPLNNNGQGQFNILKLGNVEQSGDSQVVHLLYYYFDTSDNKLPPGTYTFSFDIKSSNGTDKCYASYANGSSTIQRIAELSNIPMVWTHYSYTFTTTATNCNDVFFTSYKGYGGTYNKNNTGVIYVKNVKLEKGTVETPFRLALTEESDNIIYDISGFNNNGILTGSVSYVETTPKYNLATIFDNGSFIKKTDMNFTSNSWTASCWFQKTSSVNNAYETMLGLTRGNGADANKKFSLYIYDNKIGCVGETTSSANITTFDASLWHHACLVKNEGSFTYYLDGTSIKTFSNSTNLTDCTDFVVGGRAAVEDAASIGTPWGGNLSDVRLYATALTTTQVQELYKNSMIINGADKVPRTLV